MFLLLYIIKTMTEIDSQNYNDKTTTTLYNKIYGTTDKNKQIFDITTLSQHINLEIKKTDIEQHNSDLILKDLPDLIEDYVDVDSQPISIDKFVEINQSLNEFKQNICFKKSEYKLLSVLLRFMDEPTIVDKSGMNIDIVKNIYSPKEGIDLNINWDKLNKIEVGGLLFMNPKPSKSDDDITKQDMIKLYKIIYIGKSPIMGRTECIVVRHILFPKYYIAFTGLFRGPTRFNFFDYELGGRIWHNGNMLKNMLGFFNQVREVSIQCNDEIHEINVHIWMWEMAERHTRLAIEKIQIDFVEWWKKHIDDSVSSLEDINQNYCENTEDIYCNTNQNKKHTYFYNDCIDKTARHCCDSEKPQVCMELLPARVTNKLAKKIQEIGKKYYGNSFDNFESSRHGRPDISVTGCSLGGGTGTLSILVLIDYFSRKNQKIFNIDGTFFSGVKSTCLESFEIMRTYDNITPVNFVNSKLEFITEPTELYHKISLDLMDIKKNITFDNVFEECMNINQKFHITDIYNFIPAVNIDPFTRMNYIGHKMFSDKDYFDHMPFTYIYFGCTNTIYKDIGVHKGKLCPIYKNRKDDSSIDNKDISKKIFRIKNYNERNNYDYTFNIFKKNLQLGIRLHPHNNAKDAMEAIYEINTCTKNTFEY
jgi:hypothetical protein